MLLNHLKNTDKRRVSRMAYTLPFGAANQINRLSMQNNIYITRTTNEEQKENSRILKYFVYAFTSYNVKAIEEMLHPKGVFFGKYTKSKAAGKFYSIFFGTNGIHEMHDLHINKGLSVFPLPGSEVVEIRCSNQDPFSGSMLHKKFGDKEDAIINEKVFRFCFEFKDELITRIEFSKSFIEHKTEIFTNN